LLIYDRFVAALPWERPDPRVVLVALTDETPAKLTSLAERPFYPIPRRLHARLIDRLRTAGARVIGLDLMFAQSTEDDDALAQAMARHGRVVTALIPTVQLADGVEKATFASPVAPLAQSALTGSILVPRPFGNTVRWVHPLRPDDSRPGVRVPHFGLTLVAAYHDEAAMAPLVRDEFSWGTRLRLPLVALGEAEQVALLHVAPSFPTIPYERVVQGEYPRDFFRDKIVLVGRISAHEDRHMTPIGELPGPILHASLASQTLSGRFLRWKASGGWGAALLVGLLLGVWRFGLVPGLIGGCGLALLWLGGTYRAFLLTGTYREVLPPLAAMIVVGSAVALSESIRAGRQLARLLPSWALRGALTGRLELGTTARPVSVAFCDIRGFTRFCETNPPEAVEALLRAYFSAGDDAARRLGTELDKYLGDAMMLYFSGAEHPVRALQWARAMCDAATRLEIEVGVGIASGVAHEGLVGVPRRMQPTVIGDVVNLASRLQDATKDLHQQILMDATTAEAAAKVLKTELCGSISVRGKQEPVAVWTLGE
jgi:adenylate cyclase